MVATLLIQKTGILYSPAVYLSVVAFICFLTTLFIRESFKNEI